MPETRYPPPPDGVKCVDCGCCQAAIYAGDEPVCWACDAGAHPNRKKDPEPEPPPPPAKTVQNVQNPPEEKKKMRAPRRGGLPHETIEVIRLNPKESATSLAARLHIQPHQVYHVREKFRNETGLQPVVVDPKRSGSASALLGALDKKDKDAAGGTFVVNIHLTDAEIAKIIGNMSAEKKRQFFAGGLRAALLGE